MNPFLVDTNILLWLVRKPEDWPAYESKYAKNGGKNFISVVSLAELRSMSLQNGWGGTKIERMQMLLNKHFTVLDINIEQVIQRYAEIDAFSQGKLATQPSPFSARNMGKNDLWIAATAAAFDLELLTTDRDFDHLDRRFFAVSLIER